MKISRYRNHQKILVAVDCIIFGFDGKQLRVLLVKRAFEPEKGEWSLIGGFVKQNESVDDAANRVLVQLTGMRDIFMEQLYCFGDVNRDTAGRVISIAYYSLINIGDYSGDEAKWFPLAKLPPVIFDHRKMLAKAHERLKERVVAHPIGFELLPEKFTLPQLQSLYEAIYEKEFDKRNFARKILLLGVLNKLNEKERESSRKGAYLYVFDRAKYARLQSGDVEFI